MGVIALIKLILEYDGTGFAGWQFQPNERTVQGELESALARLTGREVRTVAAGRTDAGVHALGQVASFRTDGRLPAPVFQRALNALLPRDVAVLSAEPVPEDFHAQRSARGKWYRYLILNRGNRPALYRHRVWHVPRLLDVAAMREAAGELIGEHDFSSFRSSTCESLNPVREMRRIEVYRDGQGFLVIDLWASAFLKQMARAIVGTLVETGMGKRSPGQMKEILAARDRRRAGVTAPAHGLCLLRVDYSGHGKEITDEDDD